MSRHRVLVTGTGGASGYAVARCMTEAGYTVIWADSDAESPSLSEVSAPTITLPPAIANDYLNRLEDCINRYEVDAVSFNTDAELAKVSSSSTASSLIQAMTWIPTSEVVQNCLDKRAFGQIIANIDGVRGIPTYGIEEARVRVSTERLYAKPTVGSGGKGHFIVDDPELLEYLERSRIENLYQPLLEGIEWSADCLRDKKGENHISLRARIRVRAGMSSVTVTFHDEELRVQVETVLRELRLVGPSCVQGFITDEGVVFSEVNPRFGGGCAVASWESAGFVEVYAAALSSESHLLPRREVLGEPLSGMKLVRKLDYIVGRNRALAAA